MFISRIWQLRDSLKNRSIARLVLSVVERIDNLDLANIVRLDVRDAA
jgi:hypothetical protein